MAVPPTPPPDKNWGARMSKDYQLNSRFPNYSPLPDEIFGSRYRPKDYVDSFAERQVKLAQQTSEEQLLAGKKLVEGVQG